MRSRRNAVIAATLAAAVAAVPVLPAVSHADDLEPLTVGTKSLKGASLRLYGFVETDSIYDTTQSFTEEPDSNLVQKRSAIAGQRGREMMSARNSRLGFEFAVPPTDSGVKTKAVFELDFLGNNATNAAPGSAPGAQTERDFLNNAAVRVRHAYLDLTKDSLNAKIGQYWSLLGWQPYYFPGEAIVQPGPAQLYRRFVQARLTHTLTMGDWTLESAVDAAKPAQMNSGSPEWHAGLRVASKKCMGTSIAGAGTSLVGLSAGVSAAAVPIRTQNIQSPTGGAVAFDVLVPLIPSADGKSRDNVLTWAAEAAAGRGVGGLEYAGATFGIGGVTSSTPGNDGAIDSGIAGVNNDGNAELIRLRAFRTHLQYSLDKRWAFSTGYAQIEARNMSDFAGAVSASALSSWAPKIQYGYVSAFYDPLNWVRVAAEVNQTKDTYNDANNRYATNNRYQLSAYFMF